MKNSIALFNEETKLCVLLISEQLRDKFSGHSNLFTIGGESLDEGWGYAIDTLKEELDDDYSDSLLEKEFNDLVSNDALSSYQGRIIDLEYGHETYQDIQLLVNMLNSICDVEVTPNTVKLID